MAHNFFMRFITGPFTTDEREVFARLAYIFLFDTFESREKDGINPKAATQKHAPAKKIVKKI